MRIIALAILLVLLIQLTPAILLAPSEVHAEVVLPREKTLYIVSITSAFGGSYNPWFANAPGVELTLPLVFFFNFVTDTWTEILATYTWVNDTVLEIKIRPEARWHDGVPITSDDFIFTFETAIKRRCSDILFWCRGLYGGPEFLAAYWTKVERVDDKTVRIHINETLIRAYRRMPWVFAWLRLAPKHIFEKEINETEWMRTSFRDPAKGWPVGSGPYRLKHWDSAMVIYERIDDWWGWKYIKEYGVRLGLLKPDEPYPTDDYPPKYIVFIAQPSADIARALIIRGEVDVVATVVPALHMYPHLRVWYDEPPYYSTSATMTAFIQHIPPMNIPEFKRALFLAINGTEIASRVLMGYGIPLETPEGLPPIAVYKSRPFYDPDYIKSEFRRIYGLDWPLTNRTLAIARAMELIGGIKLPDGTPVFVYDEGARRWRWNVDMEAIGIPPGMPADLIAKKGDVVKLRFGIGIPVDPDTSAILDMIRRYLLDIGIELEIFTTATPWDDFRIRCLSHLATATYFIAYTPGPSQAAIPGQYGFVDPMYNATHTIWHTHPCGVTPPWNPGRYNNTRLSELLRELARTPITDIENNTRIIKQIISLVLEDPPFIPLYATPISATVSTMYWTGWPSAKNPYATPWFDFVTRSGYLTYLLLKPTAKPTPTPLITYTTVVTTITLPGEVVVTTLTIPVTVAETAAPTAPTVETAVLAIVVVVVVGAMIGLLVLRRRR
ncbi:MAG: ABC transporter substrate-binding protein [Desulfurococcaceae archaeon]